MRKTQPGYGVCVPDKAVRHNAGPQKDDGFYITDTSTGRRRLFASIDYLLARADPPVLIDDPNAYEIYGFHSKFNPQSDCLMLSLRWFPAAERPQWDMFSVDFFAVRYAWVTMRIDGSQLHCAVGPEQWEKGGHHATWFPDGRRISMNLNIDLNCMRFVQVNADGSGLGKMLENTTGSGHPSVHLDGRHLLTDSYEWEDIAFGDGTVPLRWVDIMTGHEETLVRINVHQPFNDSALRVDPHPAWDRSWRYVVFNAFTGGTRNVFIADMKGLLD
jgi:hypothetical protein